MTAWDDAISSLVVAREGMVADGFQSGAASRDAEVAAQNKKILDLKRQLETQVPSTPAPAEDPYASFHQLEAPAKGSTVDAGAVIQKAADSYGEITLGPGDWDVRAKGLLAVSGQHIHLADANTNLWRAYSSGAGTSAAFIRNRDFTKPIDGLAFTGPGNIAARPDMTGCVFGLKVDNLLNDGWGTTYWKKGRHTQSVGNNHRYLNPKPWRCDPSVTSGSGGLRWGGGDDFHAIGLDIWSGDDVIQVVPAGAGGDPLTNYADSTNVVYEKCVGRSYSSRFMVVGLQTDGTVTMKVSINGVVFKDCHGFGGGTGVNIANHAPSTGSIQNISFPNSSIDQSLAGDTGQPADFWVLREDNTGIVDHIDASTMKVINPRGKPYAVCNKKGSTAYPVGGDIQWPTAA